MMNGRQVPQQMMQKLLAALGLAPGGGAGAAPPGAAAGMMGMGGMDPMMDPSAAGSAMQGPPMDEYGRWTDKEGFPIYDEDVPNLPPSLKAAGERRKVMSGGGKRASKKKGGKR